jgi:hypothetical protein
MRDSSLQASGGLPKNAKASIATTITTSRKAVPQRACAVEYALTCSDSIGTPCS